MGTSCKAEHNSPTRKDIDTICTHTHLTSTRAGKNWVKDTLKRSGCAQLLTVEWMTLQVCSLRLMGTDGLGTYMSRK